MAMIKAYRMDGLGNKFIIVDRRKDLINISKEKIIYLGKLKSLHRDIGFDQIIFIEKEVDKVFPITIFNSDGSEISACGNGSSCIAYFLSKDLNTKTIRLKTNNRLLDAKIIGNLNVELAMGKPIFEWSKIPISKKIDHRNITLNIDNKIFTNGFALLGPKIENHGLFPEKTNVTFAQINDKNNITVNVWERGAGLTKACGTAACATAVAANIMKLTENNINIKFNDGNLNIKIDENLNILMRGPVSDIKHSKLEI